MGRGSNASGEDRTRLSVVLAGRGHSGTGTTSADNRGRAAAPAHGTQPRARPRRPGRQGHRRASV